jgi:hypothetical protein
MGNLAKSLRRGDPMIWLTGSALGISILMIAGLILVILVNGLSFFWPKSLERVTLRDGTVLLGEKVGREAIPNPGHEDHLRNHRIQLRLGNRDLSGSDFRWVDESDVASQDEPREAFFVERRERPCRFQHDRARFGYRDAHPHRGNVSRAAALGDVRSRGSRTAGDVDSRTECTGRKRADSAHDLPPGCARPCPRSSA